MISTLVMVIIIILFGGLIYWYGRLDLKSTPMYYKTHVELSMDAAKLDGRNWSYGTFEDFMFQFNRIEEEIGWERDIKYPLSYFIPKSKFKDYDGYYKIYKENQIHAEKFIFDNVYMVMKTPEDYKHLEDFLERNMDTTSSEKLEIEKDWRRVNG